MEAPVMEGTNAPGGRQKRTKRLLATCGLLSFGLVGAIAAPASAAPPSRPVTVPFAGVVAGTVTATGPGTFVLSGVGAASALGVVSYRGDVVVTSAPGAVPLTDTLTETLTAANGDALVIRCEQVATRVGTSGVLQGSDHWTVVGGTGRFAHASGSGIGATSIVNLQSFTKAFTGSVTIG
jgi:hypothetical protein